MSITTRDQLVNAILNNASTIAYDKGSIANAAVGQFHSLWRAVGTPGQAAIPATAATCDNTLLGAIPFTQQTSPSTSYLAKLDYLCSNALTTLEIHDRLMHMGGLNGTFTTAQTVNVDLHANLLVDNIAARIGNANYSGVQWWLEWYTDTGGTAVTATVNVTYDDASSGNLNVISLAATRRASFMQNLNQFVPVAGRYIRDVNTVTLSATTAAAGSFGVTATRFLGSAFPANANTTAKEDWASLGCYEVENEACLFGIQMAGTTSTGTVRATGKIAHG